MWPNHKMVKLRWVDVDNSTITIGPSQTWNSKSYKINDAYDVWPSLGGSAMPGFAAYAAMYHRYQVVGAKISIQAYPLANTFPFPVMVGIHMDAGASTTTTWADVMQLICANTDSVSTLVTTSMPKGLKIYRRLGSLLGNKLNYKADNLWQAQTDGSPTNIMYGYVYVAVPDGNALGGETAIGIWMKTTVTMWIRFSDRKQIYGV